MCHGSSGNKLKNEKCPQKALQSFWKKSEKLNNVLKKRYAPTEKNIYTKYIQLYVVKNVKNISSRIG